MVLKKKDFLNRQNAPVKYGEAGPSIQELNGAS
jgi:hypothetical protein